MKRFAAILLLLACISVSDLQAQVVYGGGALSDTTIAVMRLAEDAMLEDVLRRIPGLKVNDGVVTLHGKVVKQLLIDGQRFFAGDIKAGLQNISADMISKYQKEGEPYTCILPVQPQHQPVQRLQPLRDSACGL